MRRLSINPTPVSTLNPKERKFIESPTRIMSWKHAELMTYTSPKKKNLIYDRNANANLDLGSWNLTSFYTELNNKPKGKADVYSPKLGFIRKEDINRKFNQEDEFSSPTNLSKQILKKKHNEKMKQIRKLDNNVTINSTTSNNNNNLSRSSASGHNDSSLFQRYKKTNKNKMKAEKLFNIKKMSFASAKGKDINDFSPCVVGYLPFDSYTDYLLNKPSEQWKRVLQIYNDETQVLEDMLSLV